MATPKEESEKLMKSVLPFAEQMLKQSGEFYPYGGYMSSDGNIVHASGEINGNDHPKSQPIIDLLRKNFHEKGQNREIKAAAVVFNVYIKCPGTEEKTDAIQVCLDHVGDYSIEVVLPYRFTEGQLLFGKTFAQKGDNKIFA